MIQGDSIDAQEQGKPKDYEVAQERRGERGRRIELQQSATLLNSDGDVIEIVIKDLSSAGFRIEHCREDLVVGETVTIRSKRGAPAAGQIKWATATEAGGVFVDLPEVPD